MYAAFAILAALHAGGGTTLDVSLWETALSYVSYHLIGNLETGGVPKPQGTGFHAIAPYQVFPASDGGLMITCANDGLYRRLLERDRAAGARRRPALPHESRPRREPRCPDRAPLGAASAGHARRLAGEARGRECPGRAGAGHRRGGCRPAARGGRDPPAARRVHDARTGVLGRRRAARVRAPRRLRSAHTPPRCSARPATRMTPSRPWPARASSERLSRRSSSAGGSCRRRSATGSAGQP